MTKVERLVVYPLLGVLIILFSFYDLAIEKALFDPSNLFGQIGQSIGEAPFQLLGVMAGVFLFRFRPRDTKAKSICFGILFALVAIFFAGYGGGQIYTYMKQIIGPSIQMWVAVPVALVYLVIGGVPGFLLQVNNPAKAFRIALFVVIYYAAIYVVMSSLKWIWFRPRWRFLISSNGGDVALAEQGFIPWYIPQGIFHGKVDDRFSFPSGHTMNALGIISLSLFSSCFDKLKGKELLIRVCSYGWAFLVAVSRIVIGAHFASDVTFGFLFSLILFDVLSTFILPHLLQKTEAPLPSAASGIK